MDYQAYLEKLEPFKRHSTIGKVLGLMLFIMGLFLIFPGIYALFSGENVAPFLIPVPIMLILGLFMYLFFDQSRNFRTVQGLTLVAFAWLLLFIIGAVPYMMCGLSPLNAFFESVSGFTTTGSTILTDVNAYPVSLMIWRSLTQWIGGLVVILIFMYILPMFGMGRSFFSNELEGSGSSVFSVKMRSAAKSFMTVYVLLTLFNFILLLICQAGLRDALCLSFTTISTGGMICSNNSLADANIGIQLVTMVFMFIGGMNFYLHYKAISNKDPKEYWRNKEFKLLMVWFLAISLFLFIMYAYPKFQEFGFDLGECLVYYKDVLFTVLSMGTTSGFCVADYRQVGDMFLFTLLLVTFIGASAGSTGGGIKFGRLRLMVRFMNNNLKNMLRPNAVYSVKMDGQNIDDARVRSVTSVVILYIITVITATLILLTQGLSATDSLGLSISSITNMGLGWDNIGPFDNLDSLSAGIKLLLMVLMWLGRLEVTLALVFFTPAFWREARYSFRADFLTERQRRKNSRMKSQ